MELQQVESRAQEGCIRGLFVVLLPTTQALPCWPRSHPKVKLEKIENAVSTAFVALFVTVKGPKPHRCLSAQGWLTKLTLPGVGAPHRGEEG